MVTLLRRPEARRESVAEQPRPPRGSTWRRIRDCWQLYLMLLLPVVYLLIFHYWPMYGLQIAFRNYNVVQGITGSPWAGFSHFERFVESYMFWPVIRNTIVLHSYELLVGFPLPIILALALNQVRLRWFKRTVQMITYAPYFISTVVVVGMLVVLLDPRTGLLNNLLGLLGLGPLDLLSNPNYFRHLYVWSSVWQNLGFGSVIYLATLSSIDPQLHEAAIVDGASRIKRIWHIDLPGIMPVAVIMLILNIGSILSIGFEKVLLMQNNLNLSTSEVIDTYVYKIGLASEVPQYSYAAAIGLFRSVVGLILLVIANQIARRFAKSSLW
jgi:multiple sugar transport system permease protein/putative aldouronate transport system permease protein